LTPDEIQKAIAVATKNFLQHRQLAAMIEIALIIIVVALCVIAAKVNQILKLLETKNPESELANMV